MINEAFAPHGREYLIQHCKTHPFSVGTDGSNDMVQLLQGFNKKMRVLLLVVVPATLHI